MNLKLHILLIIAGLWGLTLCGCITGKTTPTDSSKLPENQPGLIDYQLRALELENSNELQLALLNWRIAEALLYERISDLTDRIGNNAEKHFQKGVTFFNKGEPEQARKEFLKTLRYDSNHQEALQFIKGWLISPRSIEYIVKNGDTFRDIAGHVYKNKQYEFIVRYFSGHKKDSELKKGDIISLPILEADFTRQFFNFKKAIAYARKLYIDKDYENLIPAAQNILKHIPDSEEAQYMINSSYYGLGEYYFSAGRFSESVDMLNKVDPRFRDVTKIINRINRAKKKQLEVITENNNSEYYKLGRRLFNQGDYIKALHTFRKVSPDYADVNDLILSLKKLIKQKAELHYREGVKYFVTEDLNRAIDEWNKALELDPENKKCIRDIENARMLLDKIKKLK